MSAGRRFSPLASARRRPRSGPSERSSSTSTATNTTTAVTMIQSGVKVDLPHASAQQMEHQEEKLVLTVTRERKIFLGTTEIAPKDLEAKLSTNARIRKDKELYLHADRTLPYGQVVEIMATARRAGVESLGMITEPEKELKRP